jgi:predicted RNA-binding protein (virulence factor B family)
LQFVLTNPVILLAHRTKRAMAGGALPWGVRIGEYQELRAVRETANGFYLADSEAEVLLPRGQCPAGLKPNDHLAVFVYTDSEDRPVATTKKPIAIVGEFAKLRVVSVTEAGAFLDWGIDKDLFCPMKEQQGRMREGGHYLVRVYLDELTHRTACTMRINRYLRPTGEGLKPGQPVKVMIAAMFPDLVSVIVDDHFKGSLFPDEIHEQLEVGDVRAGFIKSIRPEDSKIAVSLRPQGYRAILDEREGLLRALREGGGSLPVSDKSPPEEIQRRFGMSKGAFKKLIGTLYREGRIELDAAEIRLKQ